MLQELEREDIWAGSVEILDGSQKNFFLFFSDELKSTQTRQVAVNGQLMCKASDWFEPIWQLVTNSGLNNVEREVGKFSFEAPISLLRLLCACASSLFAHKQVASFVIWISLANVYISM